MPVERATKRILDMLAAGGSADVAQLTPAAIRRAMLDLSSALDPHDVPVERVEDHVLDGPGGTLRVRMYVPPGEAHGAQPGLVYFHGGVGVFGDIETHDALCRILANGCAARVFAVDYRLAPEHPFPAALEDCWFATRWVAEHATELGLDAHRIAVGGDSAGGTLACVMCQRAKDGAGPVLVAQLLLCPVTDLAAQTASREEFAEGYFLSRRVMEWAVDLYCPAPIDRRDPRLSPLRAGDLGGLPCTLVHTAEYDLLRDEGAAYAHAVADAGVEVHLTCHPGLVHHFYGMTGAVPAARRALDAAAHELRAALARRGEHAA